MKKFYITTSIAYTNAAPHLGYILELIYADALARYHRERGDEVFFLTGTDEHGAKIAKAAEKQKKTPREFVDSISSEFRELKGYFDLSWNEFIRTSDTAKHTPGVNTMWETLVSEGDIYKKKYKGLYCVGHEAFVTAKDLVDGKCVDHDREPEPVEEENYFFKLSRYSEHIKTLIQNKELVILPEYKEREILTLLEQGLEDVSFSRPRKDLAWGIPVPGDETQTIYVWADALTNYLTGIGFPDKSYETWWPADIHMIGKDILRFHAAIWPGMLIAAHLPLPKAIYVHGFVTVNGRKMSKTIGNVLGLKEIQEKIPLNTPYGVDALRYYFLREIPSGGDGDFSFDKFFERYEGDLVNGLGNFVSRVGTLSHKIGECNIAEASETVQIRISEAQKDWREKIETFHLHEALHAAWELLGFGDSYINEKEPWKTNDKKVIAGLILIVAALGEMVYPFMPRAAGAIKSLIELEPTLKMKKPETPLFPRNAF